jgi:hypothetical protein
MNVNGAIGPRETWRKRLARLTLKWWENGSVVLQLLKFSLIRRDPAAKTLTIHRLVQTVLRDRMDQDTQLQWAERAVKAVYRVFPNVEFATWSFCQRYLPQMAITWQNYACLLQATARYDQAAEFEARASALWNRRTQNLPTVTVPTGNVP